MKKILVGGATGYLGRYLIMELKKQGYWVRALARNASKLNDLNECIDEVFEGEVTRPESLSGLCEGIDVVISVIGITRQKDGLTYMDVDYQGNKNLLDLAMQHNVSKFLYISVINAHLMKDLKMIQAKERFVDELKASKMDCVIIRPTGFFSDMLEFYHMVQKGSAYLFGDGENVINPIHGADLAEICVNSIIAAEKELNVGGPEKFTFRQIAELAFQVQNRKTRILSLPLWLIRLTLPFLRVFSSSKTYGPIEFMMSIMTMDVIGQLSGKEKLEDFFSSQNAQ